MTNIIIFNVFNSCKFIIIYLIHRFYAIFCDFFSQIFKNINNQIISQIIEKRGHLRLILKYDVNMYTIFCIL